MSRRTKNIGAAVLLLVTPLAFASDEEEGIDEAALEEASKSAIEIIQYTRVLFDCEMLIDSTSSA